METSPLPLLDGRRPQRTLKVVLGLDCANGCTYCALKNAQGFEGARRSRLQPEIAEPLIRQAAEKYEISGLEVGAGETFDYPELWDWLLDMNVRELKVPMMAFTSGLSRHTLRVIDAIAASGVPVFLLVSYDGRHSERNMSNWREAEQAYRSMRERLAGSPQVTLKLTACVTPEDTRHLKNNFLSLLDLENAPFAFRPVKRSFNATQRADFVLQFASFLQEATHRGVQMAAAPEGDTWELRLKRDWTCHKLGISLLPDGRFTDCYVAWYCSDFAASRTLPSLEVLDRFFADAEAPSSPSCQACLDAFDLCNLCPAGLADFRRITGHSYYDPAFCRMVNQTSLLLFDQAIESRPSLEVVLKRGPAETRIQREPGGVLLVRPSAQPPLAIDPRDLHAPMPIDGPNPTVEALKGEVVRPIETIVPLVQEGAHNRSFSETIQHADLRINNMAKARSRTAQPLGVANAGTE
jgi:hypothetical protein